MSDRLLRPVGEGEPYPIMDDNLPEGFVERLPGGYVCGECRALVARRADAAVHRAWHEGVASGRPAREDDYT